MHSDFTTRMHVLCIPGWSYCLFVRLFVHLHLSCVQEVCHAFLRWDFLPRSTGRPLEHLCSCYEQSSTMSSVARLCVWDTEKQRQCRREADWERKCQKWAATHDAYRTANENGCQEWIRMLEGLEYMKYQSCWPRYNTKERK